jgi:hypothetical protein
LGQEEGRDSGGKQTAHQQHASMQAAKDKPGGGA